MAETLGAPAASADDEAAGRLAGDVFAGADSPAPEPPQAMQEAARQPLREFLRQHRKLVWVVVAALLITGFVVGVLPQITAIGDTLRHLGRGSPWWLLGGVALECASLAGYVLLFRTVFSCEGTTIGWRASYEITMAGVVATKLLAAAGAGGIALTAWALRAAGLPPRVIARRMAGFQIMLYAIFMLALVVVGIGLGTGAFGTDAPWALGYLPALVGGTIIALALTAGLLPAAFDRLLPKLAARRRLATLARRVSTVPAVVRGGLHTAAELIRAGDVGVVGAVLYWTFDIATLWFAFRAYGAHVAVPILIMGYFVGQLANAIPLPGGIGGVEGGMIGCFIGLGLEPDAAVVGVFAYRAISFWLPTLPGAVAYLQLRRRIANWREREPQAAA